MSALMIVSIGACVRLDGEINLQNLLPFAGGQHGEIDSGGGVPKVIFATAGRRRKVRVL